MPGMCTLRGGGLGDMDVCTRMATPFLEVGESYSRW